MTVSGDDRDLLLNQLADEFAVRRRAGERPRLEEYCDRHPDLADDIRSLFPAMLELERARADAGPDLALAVGDGRRLTTLGDFRLLREVGRGGMGVVYEAEQLSLGRRVALKLLPATVFRDPVKRRRFEREAKAAARLHHTNIVPVHGFAEHDGTPYYVMQFIPGLGLDTIIDELGLLSGRTADPNKPADPDRAGMSAVLARSLLGGDTAGTGDPFAPAAPDLAATAADGAALPPAPDRASSGSFSTSGVQLPGQSGTGVPSTSGRKTTYWQSVARIGAQVAGALAYAHQLGVLHRDIKPGNLLLDLGGVVWVTDFGLAKADDSDNLTHTGDVLGTLRYMPPEAFEGKSDARSDVYALGLTLFELVALRPAYEERDRHKLIKQVTAGDPPRLRKLRPDAPRDLVTIIEKATDRDPVRRYPTAAALTADLQRFLNDEPIRARQQTVVESVWRWARQHRSVAALAVVVFVLLTAITVGSVIAAAYFRDLEQEQRGLVRAKAALAERNERLAEENEAAKEKAEATLVDMQTARGLLAAERNDPARAVLWLAKAAADGTADRARMAGLRARNWARELTVPVRAFPVRGGVRALEFCPGKDLLLVLADDRLTVRDWRADADLRWASDDPLVGAAAWSPDGDWLAVGYSSGAVKVRGAPDGRVLQEFQLPGVVTALAVSPDGHRLAVAATAVPDGRTARDIVPWDVSGRPSSAGLGETTVRLLDLKARAMTPGEWKHPQPVYALAFNRAGDRFVSAALDKQARVFDPARPAPLFAPLPHAPRYASPPALVENDRRLVTISTYGVGHKTELTVWDAATGKPTGPGAVRARPTYPPRVVAGPRGDWFATSGHYGPEIWATADGARSVYLDDHTGYVEDLVAGPDGKTLLSASWDQTARLWSVPDGKPLGSPLPHMGIVTRCALAGDNVHLATVAEGLVRVWRRSAGTGVRTWPSHAQAVARPSFDGRLIAPGIWHEFAVAFAPIGGTLVVGDPSSGAPAGPAVALRGQLVDSCVCTDNRTVAAVCEENGTGWLILADVPSGRPVAEPVRLPGSPRSVAANPSAPRVAVLCAGGEVLVFDTRTGEQVSSEKPAGASAAGRIARVEYTSDGATLVALTTEGSGTLHVQDAATGRFRDWTIRPIPEGGGGPCRTFALSPDGKLFATAVNGKNAAQVWDLATGQPLSKPLPHPGDHYGIFCVCFSRDGRYLLTGCKDGQARLWDWRAGIPAGPSLKHDEEVFAVALSADGRFALTGGRDRASKLHVWEVKTGRLVAPKVPLSQNVVSLSLSPDGSRVIAGSLSGSTAAIDLHKLLTPPEMPVEDYRLLAELASGQRIDQGDESGLTREEWLDRLRQVNEKHPGR